MAETSQFHFAGVLRRRNERLKLYVLDSGQKQMALDGETLHRLAIRPAFDTPNAAIHAGFAVFMALDDPLVRCAFYLWDDDGLSRSVMTCNLTTGERHRTPDAAFRIGCEGEVRLIADELQAWRTARIGPHAIERYLEAVAA